MLGWFICYENNSRKDENFRIFVVRTIDSIIENKSSGIEIVENETYTTGVKDYVSVQINEARRTADRLGKEGYDVATDNPEIAKEYNLKLIKAEYQ